MDAYWGGGGGVGGDRGYWIGGGGGQGIGKVAMASIWRGMDGSRE